MVLNGRPPTKNRSVIAYAAVVFSILTSTLVATSGDNAPKILSTTGGKSGGWNSLAELKKAAEAHNPKACALYGDALLRGEDVVKQDTAQALVFLREAAAAGEANASFRLGKIYDDGEFAPKDYAKALDFYTVAAKAGVSEAQYNLGVMYASARGVKRDYVEGLAWLIVATKNGAPAEGEAQVRERLVKTNRQKQIAAAEQRAAEILLNPATAAPRARANPAATPPKPLAPTKVELNDSAAPAKISVAPLAPLPAAGSNLGVGSLSLPAQTPAPAENKDAPPKKTP